MSTNHPDPNPNPESPPEPGATPPPETSPAAKAEPGKSKRIIKQTTGRDWIIGLVVGLGILGFIVYATLSFNEQVAGLKQEGVVIEKTFVPDPEVQITVGEEGVQKDRIPGRYYLRVRMNRDQSVQLRYVDRVTFSRYEVGDTIELLKPQPTEWQMAEREVAERQAQDGEGEVEVPRREEGPPPMPLPVDEQGNPDDPAQ